MENSYRNQLYPVNGGGWNQPSQNIQVVEPEVLKSEIRIREAVIKADIEKEKQLALDEAKYFSREKRRLRKEAEYKEIIVNSCGEIQVVTKNHLISQGPHKMCNFLHPALYRLEGTNGESGVFALEVTIGGDNKVFYITEDKISSGKCLLSKIRSVGGVVYCRKESEAENFMSNLLSYLVTVAKEKIIPGSLGWNRYKDNKFYYVEKGELIWTDVLKYAK